MNINRIIFDRLRVKREREMDMRTAFGVVCSGLEKWKELMNRVRKYKEEYNLVLNEVEEMHGIESVHIELKFLMALVIDLEINNNNTSSGMYENEGKKVNDMVHQIQRLAERAEEIINSFMKHRPLDRILEEINSLKTEVTKILDKAAGDSRLKRFWTRFWTRGPGAEVTKILDKGAGDSRLNGAGDDKLYARVIIFLQISIRQLNYEKEQPRLEISKDQLNYEQPAKEEEEEQRFSTARKNQLQSLCDGLKLLFTFLMDPMKTTADENTRLDYLVQSILRKAGEAHRIICVYREHSPFGIILRQIKYINTMVWRIYYDCRRRAAAGDHRPNLEDNGNGSGIDFQLNNLKKLIDEDDYNLQFHQIAMLQQTEFVYEELGSLRSFLVDVEMIRHNYQTLQHLVNQIINLAYEAEYIIYSRKFCRYYNSYSYSHHNLAKILIEIKSIKTKVAEIYEKKLYGVGGDPQVNIIMSSSSSSTTGDSIAEDEIVVGFDSEVETIKDRLTGAPKKLDVISIVGMPGLGKTTLANKLYNDPLVVHHFYIRGWTYVTQAYRRRDSLLGILSCFVENKDEIVSMSNEELSEKLYKSLKGKRYLIVMDDIWGVRPWDDLKRCFPDESNGSRIILTSRHTNVAAQVKSKSPPHHLRFLTEEESWDLFQRKVFRKESCPPYLVEKGREIVQKCRGLPLAIVVIAGLLSKTDKTLNWWRQVVGSVSSYTAIADSDQCMNTLALSYNHLPHHLKLCFLCFSAFPEDHEIRVTKLLCLWIAEGLIRQIGQRTFEDVAEEYLMDLIDRSLVLVSKRRSTGGIKACRVHDILRDLCLRKAEEENFLRYFNGHANKQPFLSNNSSFTYGDNSLCIQREKEANSPLHQVSSSCSLVPNGRKKRRLSFNSSTFDDIFTLERPDTFCIRSLLWFRSEENSSFSLNSMLGTYVAAFKLLKVLDLSAINMSYFPFSILKLVFLRYLALQGKKLNLPESISALRNLETLLVTKVTSGSLPRNIWKMVKLRHLRIGGKNDLEFPGAENDGFPSTLNNLQTISQVCPSPSLEKVLERTLNLRKLVLCVDSSRGPPFFSLHLHFLNNLEVLCLLNRNRYGQLKSFKGCTFPQNLKRITLSNTGLRWEEMLILEMLPNLEALKLEYAAFVGPKWDTSDDSFPRLEYLRIHCMDLQQWKASKDNFPNLRHLVLSRCKYLEETPSPSDFAEIWSLHIVEVSWCSDSAEKFAREIQEEQKNSGNDSLKIHIKHPEVEEQPEVLMQNLMGMLLDYEVLLRS